MIFFRRLFLFFSAFSVVLLGGFWGLSAAYASSSYSAPAPSWVGSTVGPGGVVCDVPWVEPTLMSGWSSFGVVASPGLDPFLAVCPPTAGSVYEGNGSSVTQGILMFYWPYTGSGNSACSSGISASAMLLQFVVAGVCASGTWNYAHSESGVGFSDAPMASGWTSSAVDSAGTLMNTTSGFSSSNQYGGCGSPSPSFGADINLWACGMDYAWGGNGNTAGVGFGLGGIRDMCGYSAPVSCAAGWETAVFGDASATTASAWASLAPAFSAFGVIVVGNGSVVGALNWAWGPGAVLPDFVVSVATDLASSSVVVTFSDLPPGNTAMFGYSTSVNFGDSTTWFPGTTDSGSLVHSYSSLSGSPFEVQVNWLSGGVVVGSQTALADFYHVLTGAPGGGSALTFDAASCAPSGFGWLDPVSLVKSLWCLAVRAFSPSGSYISAEVATLEASPPWAQLYGGAKSILDSLQSVSVVPATCITLPPIYPGEADLPCTNTAVPGYLQGLFQFAVAFAGVELVWRLVVTLFAS